MNKQSDQVSFNMRNKTLLVIGATGGVGSAFTQLAINSGANVISASRNPENFDFDVESIGLAPGRFQSLTLDLADQVSIDSAIRCIVALPQTIDGVVFAAGLAHGALSLMTRDSDLRKTFEVNAFGPFRVLQGIARKLSQKASCVFVSSVSSSLPQRGSTIYGSSKAALERMALGFALELADSSIRVNVLRPGPIDTPMLEEMDPARKDELLNRSFNKLVHSPWSIANLVAFLVSEISEPVTGTVLSLDGGW
jgi:NAD(P)-dependent dehydrogenase (short-subunit alcohol dehydrogenase family)